MAKATVEQVREQLNVLGVKHAALRAGPVQVFLDFNQFVTIPLKEYTSVDELRTEIVDALAGLFRIQRETYGRFEAAAKMRHERDVSTVDAQPDQVMAMSFEDALQWVREKCQKWCPDVEVGGSFNGKFIWLTNKRSARWRAGSFHAPAPSYELLEQRWGQCLRSIGVGVSLKAFRNGNATFPDHPPIESVEIAAAFVG